MIGRILIALTVAAGVPAIAAWAAPSTAPQGRPEAFEALVRCRSLTDDAARLECFDSAAASLEDAAARRELVVVDRKQMRETKRRLFGLDIPDLNPFGGGGEDEPKEEAVQSIESAVVNAWQDGGGRWVVRLEDGSTWAQTDGNTLALRPRPGHKVKVTRASMGSYMMRVNGQPGVRAKRQI